MIGIDMHNTATRHPATAVLRVFLPFAFGYFLSYLFRVVNAVIAPDITADLGLGPSTLGLLTASYFISFASSQLPLGILLDRYGPRIIEAGLLIFAAAGALIFARAQSLTGLIVGRSLIGFGVSACLMAAFKSYVIWFPRESLARVNGIQMASGALGALAASSPVEWALGFTDWRGVFTLLALLCVLASLAVYFLVPQQPSQTNGTDLATQVKEIIQILKSREFLRLAPLAALSQGGYIGIQGLWAGPWLRDVAGLDRHGAAQILSLAAVAMVFGFIGLGSIAERLARRGIPVRTSAVTGMGALICIQALITFNAPLPPALILVFFGFFGTSGILSYTALTLAFPSHLSGRVTTGINLMVFIGAFVLQWAVGVVINLWPQVGPGQYAVEGYRAGFCMVTALQCAGLLWYIWKRDTSRNP